MISLRLSDREYEALKTEYRSHGARSISDLARLAIQQIMHTPVAPPYELDARVKELDLRLHALEARVSVFLERPDVAS